MPITFPSSPATNDVYSSGGKSWQWTGTTWDALGTQVITPVRNLLINGGFDIWQRGTTFSAGAGYTADRWYSDTSSIASRSTDVPTGQPFDYSIKFTSATSNAALRQAIELPVAGSQGQFYDGTTWTASFWVKVSAGTRNIGFYAAFTTGIGTQQRQVFLDTSSRTATTSWQRVSYTFTITPGAAVTASTCLQITPFTVGTGSAVDVFFTGVQFEPGAVATAFTRNAPSLQAELAACQRYYFLADGTTMYFLAQGQATSSSAAQVVCQFPVPMRTAPSFTTIGALSSNFILINASGGSAGAPTALALGAAATTKARIDASGVSGLTAGNATTLQNGNTGTGLSFSAEL